VNLRLAPADDKNVRGLDVAVNDPFGVRGIEGIGNLNCQVEQLVRL
jgi:hypothetical protein